MTCMKMNYCINQPEAPQKRAANGEGNDRQPQGEVDNFFGSSGTGEGGSRDIRVLEV